MAENNGSTWRRTVNRYLPLAAVIAGLILILLDHPIGTAAAFARVSAGIALALAGYLYRSRPFLTSERKHTALRGEVDIFIDLVRELNRTAVAIGGGPEFDQVTRAMRESMKRIEELAGKEA